MQFKLYSYVPHGTAILHDIPLRNEFSTFFIPDAQSLSVEGIISDVNSENECFRSGLGDLRIHYHALNNLPQGAKHIGFEHVDRPFFIDPMQGERLVAQFPKLADVRCKAAQEWAQSISPATLDDLGIYYRMRSALNEADYARLSRWLARVDIVVPWCWVYHAQAERKTQFSKDWPGFVEILKDYPLYKDIPEDVFEDADVFPQSNSYIARTDLFEEFAKTLFDALSEYNNDNEDASIQRNNYFSERLFGVYVYKTFLNNPMLRIASVPVLIQAPSSAPLVVPKDFDPDMYLRNNPDVSRAGANPEDHYLHYGWREGRKWSMLCD